MITSAKRPGTSRTCGLATRTGAGLAHFFSSPKHNRYSTLEAARELFTRRAEPLAGGYAEVLH
jgi:hypothetical protein